MPAAVPRRPVAASLSWLPKVLLGAQVIVSLATLAGGVFCFLLHNRADAVEHILAPAGCLLLVFSLVQARVALVHARQAIAMAKSTHGTDDFVSALVAGAIAMYLATLVVGPVREIGWAWLTAVVGWYTTLLILPLAAPPTVLEQWRTWSQRRHPRRTRQWAAASVALLAVSELGLQSYHAWQDSAAAPLGAPQAAVDGPIAWGRLDADHFRVAVLGDEHVLQAADRDGCLARVRQMFPGLELVPVAMSGAWTRDSQGDLHQRLAASQADLVLALVAVCDDLAAPKTAKNWFDWRQLELAQLVVGAPAVATKSAPPANVDEVESFLHALAPQLAACRTPLDATMQTRWQRTFAALDGVLEKCRQERLPLALVLVPGQIQVNRSLRETLARRTGHTAEQIDVDLPQRRWAGFANARDVAVLDLLPHLRLCSASPYLRNTKDWNEEGAQTVAAALGGWLESRYRGQLATAAQLSRAQ